MKSITDKGLSELTERLDSLQQRQAEQQRAVVACWSSCSSKLPSTI
jgi:hypothetical protein